MAISRNISSHPTPYPDKDTQDPSTFNGAVDEHLRWMADELVPDINEWADQANTTQDNINDAESTAVSAKDTATASANFKGEWGTLSGSLAVPASVLHNDKYWMLLNDVDDVTACEPGVSGDWAEITLYPYTWRVKSSSYTASTEEIVSADTSGGAFTITLSDSPSQGDIVGFEDYARSWGTNNLTVDGNGNNILGVSTFTADVDDWAFALRFNGTQWIFAWRP